MKFQAIVIKGEGNGRILGFPTINLELKGENLPAYTNVSAGRELRTESLEKIKDFQLKTLAHGVYACKVIICSSKLKTPNSQLKTYSGAMHYGVRKTMNLSESLEVHLLDYFGEDLYGETVEVLVLKKIRDVQKFSSIDELKARIIKDIEEVRGV